MCICRWDENAVSFLPEYLKKFYLRILRTFKEIHDTLAPDEQYKVSYAQKSVRTDNYIHNPFIFPKKEFKKNTSIRTRIALINCRITQPQVKNKAKRPYTILHFLVNLGKPLLKPPQARQPSNVGLCLAKGCIYM